MSDDHDKAVVHLLTVTGFVVEPQDNEDDLAWMVWIHKDVPVRVVYEVEPAGRSYRVTHYGRGSTPGGSVMTLTGLRLLIESHVPGWAR